MQPRGRMAKEEDGVQRKGSMKVCTRRMGGRAGMHGMRSQGGGLARGLHGMRSKGGSRACGARRVEGPRRKGDREGNLAQFRKGKEAVRGKECEVQGRNARRQVMS